jgi:hypothetical protein
MDQESDSEAGSYAQTPPYHLLVAGKSLGLVP